MKRTSCPAGGKVHALQVGGDGVDGIRAGLDIGAGGIPLDEITTHILVIITG